MWLHIRMAFSHVCTLMAVHAAILNHDLVCYQWAAGMAVCACFMLGAIFTHVQP